MKKKILVLVVAFLLVVVVGLTTNNSTTKIISYNGNNLRISIDGNSSNTLPSSGNYYLVSYDCKDSSTKLSWDKNNYKLKITNNTKKGGASCYLNFKSRPFLSEMEPGSYVAYTGDSNNGCDDTNVVNGYTSCSGKNANYVSDVDMGYCYYETHKFYVNGWRIGYIENGSAYLISAGSPECMCTDSSGNVSSSSCSSSLSSNFSSHLQNMDDLAYEYCNSDFSKDGDCGFNTAWAMNAMDFSKITGNDCDFSGGYATANDVKCGYINDLIDNGGNYWIATLWDGDSQSIFYWRSYIRHAYHTSSASPFGVRPVLYLDSNVYVTGGSGTYEDPYQIGNNNFLINGGVDTLDSDDDLDSIPLTMISGDDVSGMCVSVNTSVCSNYVSFSSSYSLDWSQEADGKKVVYVYYKDAGGNIIAAMNKSVILDTSV